MVYLSLHVPSAQLSSRVPMVYLRACVRYVGIMAISVYMESALGTAILVEEHLCVSTVR